VDIFNNYTNTLTRTYIDMYVLSTHCQPYLTYCIARQQNCFSIQLQVNKLLITHT